MVKVIITHIPSGYLSTYYQWFILGFYELKNNEKIDFEFDVDFCGKIKKSCTNETLLKVFQKFEDKFIVDNNPNLEGIVIVDKSNIKKFAIDCLDSPFAYNLNDLKNVDVYFKMQCPKSFENDGFNLNHTIKIPWHDNKTQICIKHTLLVNKVKPLMVGPRRISYSLNYKKLKNNYTIMLGSKSKKTGYIMSYFGNSLGPKPQKIFSQINYSNESQLMGYFTEINHPNEKRKMASDIISNIKNCDTRIINTGYSDTGKVNHPELVIPLNQFGRHIEKFQYNLNVSGYRLSIPNRFIESFMVGTAILTDKLFVRWYKGFEEEVYETVEMGYLPLSYVDWKSFKYEIKELPTIDSERIIKLFEKKWSPTVAAKYIVDSVING